MDYLALLKQMEQQILPHLSEDEPAKGIFLQQVKLLKKGFIGGEFKLKRTIQDKQITTNVLENTITELKIKTENLKHQKTLTEEQAAFKEQLFANVSHELRTPIHGILGMSHLLENTKLNEEQQDFIEIIRSSADNLLVIINDLLNLSKINAGKTTLINAPFSVEKFINDLKGVLTFKAKGKGIDFIVLSPPNLPKFLLGDRIRLYQILINLLNNALKYTEQGYVALNIYVLKQNLHQVDLQFEIKDTGIGIAATKLSTIFENFTQLNTNNNELHGGVGLGLNIAKKLLSMMGGTFKVKSKTGKGTTFTVNLSFKLPTADLIKNLGENNIEFKIPKYWQQKKILMIEDNEANLVYAQNLFASWQLNLEVAENLVTAHKKLRHHHYDCILSDVKLPDGNGLDLIAQLRADNSAINQSTPIIVLTASANDKEATYAQKLNVQSYIGKPFPPQLLIREMGLIFQHDKKSNAEKTVNTTYKKANNFSSTEVLYFANLEKNFKGKPKLQIEMFEIFLAQLPEAIQQMGKGLAENDLAMFHYDAHRIKSTINIIGLPKLKPLITKMDEYCYKKINLDELPDLYQQFKAQARIDMNLILTHKESLLVDI